MGVSGPGTGRLAPWKGTDAERTRAALIRLMWKDHLAGKGGLPSVARLRAEAKCSQPLAAEVMRGVREGDLDPSVSWDPGGGSATPVTPSNHAGGGSAPTEDDDALLEALAARIRAASTDGEREAVAQEAAALVALGTLQKDAAGGIASLLLRAHVSAEMRRRVEPAPEDPTRLLLASAEALETARELDLFINDDLRDQARAFVAAKLAEDLARTPNVDEGGAGVAA